MIDNLIMGVAVAVPAVFLAWRVWTGHGNDRTSNINWALFAIPVLTWGVLKGSLTDLAGGALLVVLPFALDRAWDQAFPPRRRK